MLCKTVINSASQQFCHSTYDCASA